MSLECYETFGNNLYHGRYEFLKCHVTFCENDENGYV